MKKQKKEDDFNVGQAVTFDDKRCFVTVYNGKKCLKIAHLMGWFHFIPEDWNDVTPA